MLLHLINTFVVCFWASYLHVLINISVCFTQQQYVASCSLGLLFRPWFELPVAIHPVDGFNEIAKSVEGKKTFDNSNNNTWIKSQRCFLLRLKPRNERIISLFYWHSENYGEITTSHGVLTFSVVWVSSLSLSIKSWNLILTALSVAALAPAHEMLYGFRGKTWTDVDWYTGELSD